MARRRPVDASPETAGTGGERGRLAVDRTVALTRAERALVGPVAAVLAVWTLLLVVPPLAPAEQRDLALLASFAAAIAVAWRVRPAPDAPPGPARSTSATFAFVAGLLGYPACVTLVSVLGLEAGLVRPPDRTPGAGSPALWVATVALAPVFEEILYRGRLLAALRARVGGPIALVATSAVFALPHVAPWSVLATFVVGLWLGGMRLAGAPLAACIALHAGLNLASIVCGGPPQQLALPPAASLAAAVAAVGSCLLLARRASARSAPPRRLPAVSHG